VAARSLKVGRIRILALILGAAALGCAVAPLPRATALRGQPPQDHAWDARECRWEAEARTHYNADYSPGGNLLTRVFVWGVSGAALGGVVTAFPASTAGPASEGLIAGSGAGGLVGGIKSLSGQERFERAWRQCMEGRGYAVTPAESPAPLDQPGHTEMEPQPPEE
jgi:hypothetical protein